MSATDTHTQQTLADDPQMPRPGTVVGARYEIQDVLGEGGFAVVYRAFDQRTKGEVAVKVLDPIMSRRKEFSSRFMREVETVSRLRHHNSISIFDAGEMESGCLFLVMELLEGRPLDTVLESETALPYDRVQNIAAQILKSLQEAHSKGIIHRDLKPANVFLADLAGERDYVKVLDFGIAKSVDESQDTSLTATGQVMCSPHYVAPERIKDHMTVAASDLYSLGVMMIELIEGKPPYEADSPMMLAVKHLSAEPVPMGEKTLAAPYAGVIQRACAKNLEDRYETAIEMLDELLAGRVASPVTQVHAAAGGHTIVSPPVPAANTDAMVVTGGFDDFTPTKSRTPLLALLALFILAGFGAVFLIVTSADSADEAAAAAAAATELPATPEPVEVPPVVQGDPASNVRTARALVSGAIAEGRTASILALRAAEQEAAQAALDAQLAAAEIEQAGEVAQQNEARNNEDRNNEPRSNSDREARAEREAAAEAQARAERDAREREARRAIQAEQEREALAAAAAAAAAEAAAAEEEEESGRPRIRTNVAPRQ